MSADPLTTRPRAANSPLGGASTRDTWHEIETLVDELAALAKTDLPVHDFYAALLDRTVRSLAAMGGAVWLRGPGGLVVEYQIGLAQTRFSVATEAADNHLRWIESVSQAGEVQVLPPN